MAEGEAEPEAAAPEAAAPEEPNDWLKIVYYCEHSSTAPTYPCSKHTSPLTLDC